MIVQADGLNLALIIDNNQPLKKCVDDIFYEIYLTYRDFISLPNFKDNSLMHFISLDDKLEYIAEAPASWLDTQYWQHDFLPKFSKLSLFSFFPDTTNDDIALAFSDMIKTYWKVHLCKAFKAPITYSNLPFLYGELKNPFQPVWINHGVITNLSDYNFRQFKFSVSPVDLSLRYEVNDFRAFVALCLLLYLKNINNSNFIICPICGRSVMKKRADAICCCTEHAAAFGKIKVDLISGQKDTLAKIWTRARKRTNKMANEYDWQEPYNQWYNSAKSLYAAAKKAAISPSELDQQLIDLWNNCTKGLPRK